MAETQTVLWMRVLDRLRGANPPQLVVVDPRTTPTAREADVHLRPRLGTNVALLNGLLRLIIQAGWYDERFVREHTVGFDRLASVVSRYPPARVAEITGVPERQLREAAELLGTAPTLVSSCLQGVYQSHQATAAAIQVNNLNLVRGMIGKPGCSVFQMNGQPTAQNTRETGANGELAAFLNWANPEHVKLLAEHWNVEPEAFPHYGPPTHVMQMMRYAEEGSLRMLWITATNPAVSLPELDRVRRILGKSSLFVVVSDAFETETTRLADVVFPAALWGEKTGTFTNADRTVHISERAIDPPGEARSDFEILLEYARRMGFSDKHGAPLVKWSTVEEAFDDFKKLTRGRPCDYSGLSYAKLTGGSGIQWPCNEQYPDGCERLYTNRVFNTAADTCELYGHDIETGAAFDADEYKAHDPHGKAWLKAAEYQPPPETADDRYPFLLTTGRRVYQFHTRTKTGRARELAQAAPDAWVEICEQDAALLGVRAGDWLELESRRGKLRARAQIADILPGHLFVPFHYGYWDHPMRARAANELTSTTWDPVSKQPLFKLAAVKARRVDEER